MKAGIVFPGMGPSGYADLGKFIVTDRGAVRLRRAADQVLGYSLMDRYRTAGEDYSVFSQLAFLISCLALIEHANDLGEPPVACTGPSFGAKVALAYAGSLSFTETVLLTARIARCEEEYFAHEHRDVLTQSVARLPEPLLRGILGEMEERGEWHDISCHIDDDFFMVSMRESSLERFLAVVRAAGGLPLYAMRPPMHSPVFASLRRRIEDEILTDFPFADPRLPVVADQDGSVISSAEGLRAMLLDGIVRPVRWPAVVRSMASLGITRVYVSGLDRLFSRVPCTVRNFDVVAINPKTAMRPRNYAA